MNELHKRVVEISQKHELAHVGSCLTAVSIIDEIYAKKKKDERFVLSCGHAGLALYVVLEKYLGADAEKLYLTHGTHPNKDEYIDCSTGSLGMGLMVATGMALSDRTKNVYCLLSDGECFEGSIWETANVIQKYDITNLKIYMNHNTWSAYDKVEEWFIERMRVILPQLHIRKTRVEDYGLQGLSAHYSMIAPNNCPTA